MKALNHLKIINHTIQKLIIALKGTEGMRHVLMIVSSWKVYFLFFIFSKICSLIKFLDTYFCLINEVQAHSSLYHNFQKKIL